jgi:hypothetical protein
MADSRDTAARRRTRFLRRGSVPLFAHGLLEYGIGILAIAAPFLFSFDHNGAIAFSVFMGTAIRCSAASTDGPTGSFETLPVASHVVLDVVVGVVLVVAPFVFASPRTRRRPHSWFCWASPSWCSRSRPGHHAGDHR